MSEHLDKTSGVWDENSPDIDRPHGLDYQQLQYIMAAVRKRIEKQHTTFGDVTAGGLHRPGKVSVLKIEDTTAKFNTLITEASCAEFGIGCMTSTGTLYYVNDATTVWETLPIFGSICRSGDMTWGGAHEFDGTVDFSTAVGLKGVLTVTDLSVSGGAYFDGTMDISGSLNMTGKFEITGDVSIAGKMEVSDAVFDGSVDISQSLYCWSNVNIAGDFSGTGTVHDRIFSAWARVKAATGDILDGYNVANADRSAAGHYCISFTTAMADANYAAFAISNDPTTVATGLSSANTIVATGFYAEFASHDGNLTDPSTYSVFVLGG